MLFSKNLRLSIMLFKSIYYLQLPGKLYKIKFHDNYSSALHGRIIINWQYTFYSSFKHLLTPVKTEIQ